MQSGVRRWTTGDEVSAHTWYHTIELPDGTTTRGTYDHRPLLPHYGLPDDLHGKRALDIGSGDGFWAFELERRGAEVDEPRRQSVRGDDFPRALRQIYPSTPSTCHSGEESRSPTAGSARRSSSSTGPSTSSIRTKAGPSTSCTRATSCCTCATLRSPCSASAR